MKRSDIFKSYANIPNYNYQGAETAKAAFMHIKNALDQVVRFDNLVVPKAWIESFPETVRSTMESIGKHIEPTPAFFSAGAAFRSLDQYRTAHGQTYRMFVATLDYLATGEGRTLKLFAHRAYSLGEFIATIDDDPYFIQGMNFYQGIPTKENIAFEAFSTKYIRSLINSKDGHVVVKLETHVNYS